MKKRRSAQEVERLLRDADRDLTKGLTVSDICRKIGVAETTYYRWRQRHDPASTQDDAGRRCRVLESEVESVEDAREQAKWFRRECNRVRPHRSLGYRTLSEFAASCEKKEEEAQIKTCNNDFITI